MLTVTRRFTFEAAHHLPFYDGKCNAKHGHSYKLYVTVSHKYGEMSGMVVEFSRLKHIVKDAVIDKLDHTDLNLLIENPTAEEILFYIKDELEKAFEEFNIVLEKLELWETENCYATYIKD